MNEEEIGEKKVLTANQMTGELLLGIVIYGVISYVIYRFAFGYIGNFLKNDKNFIMLGIVALGLQAVLVFFTFKLANRQAFKRGTISKDDVSNVIKNVSFVIIVILLIQALSVFTSVNSAIDKAIEENSILKYREKLMSMFYTEDQMAIYNTEKEKAIQEAKNQIYQYLAIVEVGIVVIYGSAIFLEKKSIYKRAVE